MDADDRPVQASGEVSSGKKGNNSLISRTKWPLSGTVTIAAVACGLGLGVVGLFPIPDIDFRLRVPFFDRREPVPVARNDPGGELVVVVIGASTCVWSNSDAFEKVVRKAKETIQAYARQRQLGFATMGISVDTWADTGMEYLSRFGRFDEIAVGRSWRNTSALKYIYGAYPGPAATPQVLVVARTVVQEGGQWAVDDERVLVRKIGISEIEKWVAGGAGLGDIAKTLDQRRHENG